MVRFIFFCMAVLALSVAAIPLTTLIDGIAKERAETLASATLAETPGTPDPDYFAATAAPAEEELNAIETAAGGTEGVTQEAAELKGGFTDTPPRALAEDVSAPVAAPAPQDN